MSMDKKSFADWFCESVDKNGGVSSWECFLKGQQSRQTEVDQLQSQINEMAEVGLSQESAIREKDKRINQALNFINNWWHPDLDQKLFVEALGRALRGEHE